MTKPVVHFLCAGASQGLLRATEAEDLTAWFSFSRSNGADPRCLTSMVFRSKSTVTEPSDPRTTIDV